MYVYCENEFEEVAKTSASCMVAAERSAVTRSDARRQYPHSHLTVFKSILFVSFRRLLTSRKSAIRRLPDSQPEL